MKRSLRTSAPSAVKSVQSEELRSFQAADDGIGLRTRTWRHDHPKLRTALLGNQPPDTAKRFESYDRQRIDILKRGYQPADLQSQGEHTMNLRQIHNITCDGGKAVIKSDTLILIFRKIQTAESAEERGG